jgi:hypothetical protein
MLENSNPTESQPTESPSPSAEPVSSIGDIPVTLDAPPPAEAEAPAAPVDSSDATAATAAEVVSGFFQVLGGETDFEHVTWRLSDEEKAAFAADLAPLLRKYGIRALPFPEEMRFAVRAVSTAAPRIMKLRQEKKAEANAGRAPELQEVGADGHRGWVGEKGNGQVDPAAKAHLGMFAGPATPRP